MNGPTCAAFWTRPSFCRGPAPWPPHRSQSGRLMAPATEVCLRKQLLILSVSLLVFPTDRLGLSRAPNWTVKTHRAVRYINVDTDRPRDLLPVSPHCCLEVLMKMCGHFRALSHNYSSPCLGHFTNWAMFLMTKDVLIQSSVKWGIYNARTPPIQFRSRRKKRVPLKGFLFREALLLLS